MPPQDVKLVVTDVDGVLTDGTIGLDGRGEEFKVFSVQDGLGARLLEESGIGVGFLSSRDSPVVRLRAKQLGIDLHFSGVEEKKPQLEEILRSRGVESAETCYLGDDLLDIPCLRLVGFPVAVANAREEVKAHAEYVTRLSGGHGAFREVSELVLRARGLWELALERYQ